MDFRLSPPVLSGPRRRGLGRFEIGAIVSMAFLVLAVDPSRVAMAQEPGSTSRRGTTKKLNGGGSLRTPPSLSARSGLFASGRQQPLELGWPPRSAGAVELIHQGEYLDADLLEQQCLAGNGPIASAVASSVEFEAPDLCTLPGGISHVISGVGLRNEERGTIGLVGPPEGSLAVLAELIWAVIVDPSEGAELSPSAFLNGQPLTGVEIGRTDAPCWGPEGIAWQLVAYKAPVSRDLLHPGITGEYLVEGVPTSSTSGESPFGSLAPEPPLAEGASLMVIYSHQYVPRETGVYRFDFVSSHRGASRHQFALLPSLPNSVEEVKLSEVAADGQTYDGESWVYGLSTSLGHSDQELTSLGRAPRDLTPIRAQSGSVFSQHAPWQGRDGMSEEQQLWDSQTMAFNNWPAGLQAPVLEPGAASFTVCYETPGVVSCPLPDMIPVEQGPSGDLSHDCIVPVRLVLEITP